MPSLTRALPCEERVIGTRGGESLFAHAIAPQKIARSPMASRVAATPLAGLHGGDPVMASVAAKAVKLADAPIHLLLQGETGTGKEYVARRIHDTRRNPGDFVAVNCAAIPETLIESELFGYEAGAFTGARVKGKRGLIEQADGGTLFLDEIGDMPMVLQARLLRVLAESEVLRIGAVKPVSVNIRVLSASHRNLIGLVKEGKFREDLFYRLTGATLQLPPLRERQDIDWLVERLLQAMSDSKDEKVLVSQKARQALRSYDWPGNIRELNNALQFALAFCPGHLLELAHFPDKVSSRARDGSLADVASHDVAPDDPIPRFHPTERTKETRLAELLVRHRWNVSAVARHLGVDRSTVHRRMKKAGLIPPNRR